MRENLKKNFLKSTLKKHAKYVLTRSDKGMKTNMTARLLQCQYLYGIVVTIVVRLIVRVISSPFCMFGDNLKHHRNILRYDTIRYDGRFALEN